MQIHSVGCRHLVINMEAEIQQPTWLICLVVTRWSQSVSVWMGDHLQAGKLPRYVTSHPGQLSLAIPLWVGTMSTSLGWEGNHRSGVALAMRHRH